MKHYAAVLTYCMPVGGENNMTAAHFRVTAFPLGNASDRRKDVHILKLFASWRGSTFAQSSEHDTCLVSCHWAAIGPQRGNPRWYGLTPIADDLGSEVRTFPALLSGRFGSSFAAKAKLVASLPLVDGNNAAQNLPLNEALPSTWLHVPLCLVMPLFPRVVGSR